MYCIMQQEQKTIKSVFNYQTTITTTTTTWDPDLPERVPVYVRQVWDVRRQRLPAHTPKKSRKIYIRH